MTPMSLGRLEWQYRNSMTPNIKLGKSLLKLAHIPCSKNEGIWCYIKKKVLKADKFVFSRNLPIELSGRLNINLAWESED